MKTTYKELDQLKEKRQHNWGKKNNLSNATGS